MRKSQKNIHEIKAALNEMKPRQLTSKEQEQRLELAKRMYNNLYGSNLVVK